MTPRSLARATHLGTPRSRKKSSACAHVSGNKVRDVPIGALPRSADAGTIRPRSRPQGSAEISATRTAHRR